MRERRGSVVECLTRDRGAAGSSLTGVTVLWSLSKAHYPSLILVQPRKARPCLTERLLMGRKESNQTNKITSNEHEIYPAHTFICMINIYYRALKQDISVFFSISVSVSC